MGNEWVDEASKRWLKPYDAQAPASSQGCSETRPQNRHGIRLERAQPTEIQYEAMVTVGERAADRAIERRARRAVEGAIQRDHPHIGGLVGSRAQSGVPVRVSR
jgi:hypothetical protein